MGSAPTPEGLKGPMYLIVNLAVGGKWPGPTNSSTPDEARFQLDYIRVWQRPEDKAAAIRQGPRQRLRPDNDFAA